MNAAELRSRLNAVSSAKEYIDLIAELDNVEGDDAYAIACCARARLATLDSQYSESLEWYQRALETFEQMGLTADVAKVLGGIGATYSRLGDVSKALEVLHRSYDLQEQLGDVVNSATNLSNIGTIFCDAGDFPKAFEYFSKSLNLFEQSNSLAGMGLATANIGIMHARMDNHAESMQCFRRVHAMALEIDDREAIAHALSSMGNSSVSSKEFESALEYFRESLSIYQELNDHELIAHVLSNIGTTLVRLGRLADAHDVLKQLDAMHYSRSSTTIDVRMLRSLIMLTEGDVLSSRTELLDALASSERLRLPSKTAEIHKQLCDLALTANDLAAYVFHNKEYMRITEETRGREATTRLAVMEAERRLEHERREHERHLAVLHSTLPQHIASRVANGETVNDYYECASVIFLDIVDFTTIADTIPSGDVVHLLHQVFGALDAVCQLYDVAKIKTIGDSYMAVSFASTEQAALCACAMIRALKELSITLPPSTSNTAELVGTGSIQVRIGIHCGPLTAGVIGSQRMQYDVWGDTVNIASRMESTGEPGHIHVSDVFANSLHPNVQGMVLKARGTVNVKGKGPMHTYWLIERH